MTAIPDRSRLTSGFVPGLSYQVVVRAAGDSNRAYHWEISLFGPLSEVGAELVKSAPEATEYLRGLADGPEWWSMRARLTTPPVTTEQAKALALAWLAAVEGVDPDTVDCVLVLPGFAERINDPGARH